MHHRHLTQNSLPGFVGHTEAPAPGIWWADSQDSLSIDINILNT